MTVNTLNSRSFSRSVQALGLVAGTMIGSACLSLGTIGEAKAFTFSEPPDAGAKLNNAADTTGLGAVGSSSTIEGFIAKHDPDLVSPDTDKNKADLFKILIDVDGTFTAQTEGRDPNAANRPPNPIEDPFLYLFDSSGMLITDNDDISYPDNLQSSITQFLTAGNYYLGITKYGHNPTYDSSDILTGWSGDLGKDNLTANGNSSDRENRSAYRINLTHTPTGVPTPALLPGLVGMGLSVWRKRKEESRV
jgi:Bacterial pre-peptidase C-terminal domain